MNFEWWELLTVCAYFWYAGVNAEYNHNYTCNIKLSILLSLILPLMIPMKKPKSMPKYYRDGHYKKDQE